MKKNRINRIYWCMRDRCYNKNSPSFKNYGKLGITVCKEWLEDYKSFEQWALRSGYADGLTIDRIDNTKGYEPNNCRWATMKEQQNHRSNNRMITYKGKTQTLSQWCDELGLNYSVVKIRFYNHHWDIKRVFETPARKRLRPITYKGKTQTLKEWCLELGLNYPKMKSRIFVCNWSAEKAFETK